MSSLRLFVFAVSLLFVAAQGASALVIGPGDGSVNLVAPANDPGFANVAALGSLSGVYLGDRWMLTAGHVGAQAATLGGVVYQPEAGSAISFSGVSGPADLIMFRLEEDPQLAAISIIESSPGLLAEVVMIGNGRGRGNAITEGPSTLGYEWGGSEMRWGTNWLAGYSQVDLGGYSSTAFFTTFDGGTAYEAQAAPGDSGGAVFVSNGDSWELAGIMIATGSQQAGAALYGDTSYAVDLAPYLDDIQAATGLGLIPEPGTALLLALGLGGLSVGRRRRGA